MKVINHVTFEQKSMVFLLQYWHSQTLVSLNSVDVGVAEHPRSTQCRRMTTNQTGNFGFLKSPSWTLHSSVECVQLKRMWRPLLFSLLSAGALTSCWPHIPSGPQTMVTQERPASEIWEHVSEIIRNFCSDSKVSVSLSSSETGGLIFREFMSSNSSDTM